METIDGSWTICGLGRDDPRALHTVDEAIEYINEVGFLPFFQCGIPGFSLEERTISADWWGPDPSVDPWEWRAVIARSGKIAYGKFFSGKAGFITPKWLPYFVNYRRDGYDFDALWDDEKASLRQKKIMDVFMSGNKEHEPEYFTNEIKQLAGFGKGGEKGFEGTLSSLEMQLYLCDKDFRQRKNKKGESYGWAIAVLSTPEDLFGRELVTSAYKEDPARSAERIAGHIKSLYPNASDKQINKVLG